MNTVDTFDVPLEKSESLEDSIFNESPEDLDVDSTESSESEAGEESDAVVDTPVDCTDSD